METIMKKFKVVDGKVQCKCGHWISIVGSKWQHMRTVGTQVYYREGCYYCECINPVPDLG